MIYKANADDTVKLAIEAENKFRAINAAQYEAGYAAAEEKYSEELKIKDNALLEKDNALLEKDNALLEKDNALQEKENALQEKDNEIASLKARLAELEG